MAAAEGHEKIVGVLIEQGAGVGVQDIEGKTALDIATDKGYTDITQLLKDRAEGRKLVCFTTHCHVRTLGDGNNFEYLQRTVNAGVSMDTGIENHDTDTARTFQTTAEGTMEFHSDPHSALHTAAENGNLEEVQRLVEDGIALDYGDSFGRTALWGAAKSGHSSIIQFLLQNGSCTNIPDCEGMTPIEIAARKGHWDVVDEFLEHDPTIGPEGTEYLMSQLYEASESGDLEVVRIILKCGISVNTTNNYGKTPLHVAAKYGQKEVTRLLLQCGADVNRVDNDGKVPFLLAVENGNVEIIRDLAKKIPLAGFQQTSSQSLQSEIQRRSRVSE